MKYTEEQLYEIRLEDIDFFAKRYAELFSSAFGKDPNVFYDEIKNELSIKANKYTVEEIDRLHEHEAEAMHNKDSIMFSEYSIKNKATRIHELFHAYNEFKDENKQGLKDFNSDFILKDLDEGTTEMFAQMICGNDKGKPDAYSNDVEISRLLMSIIGKDKMIKATRGNPEILIEEVDKAFGTQNLIQDLSKTNARWHEAVDQSWKENESKANKMLAKIQLEEMRGHSAPEELFEIAEKLEDKSAINKLIEADREYNYNIMFSKSTGINCTVFNPNEKTLADVQQEMLKDEIDELGSEDFNLQTDIELEIKKFMYDRIDFQKHFLNHEKAKYGKYELNQEDIEYANNFTSNIDGEKERLGGKIGIEGPGCYIYDLDNAPHLINETDVKKISISGIGLDELKDYRFEMWAEKLNIEQEKEFLDKWETYIYNAYCKEELNFLNIDDEEYNKAIQGIRDNLEQKDKGLIEKYRALDQEKQKEKTSSNGILQSSIKSNSLFKQSRTKTSRVNQTLQAIKDLLRGKSKEKEEHNLDE